MQCYQSNDWSHVSFSWPLDVRAVAEYDVYSREVAKEYFVNSSYTRNYGALVLML